MVDPDGCVESFLRPVIAIINDILSVGLLLKDVVASFAAFFTGDVDCPFVAAAGLLRGIVVVGIQNAVVELPLFIVGVLYGAWRLFVGE